MCIHDTTPSCLVTQCHIIVTYLEVRCAQLREVDLALYLPEAGPPGRLSHPLLPLHKHIHIAGRLPGRGDGGPAAQSLSGGGVSGTRGLSSSLGLGLVAHGAGQQDGGRPVCAVALSLRGVSVKGEAVWLGLLTLTRRPRRLVPTQRAGRSRTSVQLPGSGVCVGRAAGHAGTIIISQILVPRRVDSEGGIGEFISALVYKGERRVW